jgi:hypothetical protein
MAKYSNESELKVAKDQLLNLLLLFTIVTFLICSSFFLNNDFWQDEIYTLDHFVFQSWKTIFTDYHSTNNHILFNLFLKLVIASAGITEIKVVLEYPFILRLVPFFFSLLCIYFLYKGVYDFYGPSIAKIILSVFCTTIVFVDFSCQLRGYSLSILITILQFLAVLNILKHNKRRGSFFLFFLTLGSLICLPTNIYLSISIVTVSVILWLSENIRKLVVLNRIKKRIFIDIIQPLVAAIIISGVYYLWLLSLQSKNELISAYSIFNLKNLIQASAVFYQYMDYRFYFILYCIVWTFLIISKRGNKNSIKIFLPAALYFLPFVIFYFHGVIIIQRVFLSLLPFFTVGIGIVIHDVNSIFNKKKLIYLIIILNLLLLIFSFKTLISDSIQNNKNSIHKHSLREHYYLINFNAKEASLLASELSRSMNKKLIVWDDFGETGIKYYLKHFRIPYDNFSKNNFINKENIYLVNNKQDFEMNLKSEGFNFKRILSREKQYNLYLLR